MFQLDLPNVYEVINNGKFKLDEALKDEDSTRVKDVRSKQIVVVSVFGSTWNQTLRGSRFKRAFQLSLDAFGTLSLFNKNVTAEKKKQNDPQRVKVDPGAGGDKEKNVDGITQSETDIDQNVEAKGDTGIKASPSEPAPHECGQEKEVGKTNVSSGGILEGFFNEDESVLFLHIEGLAFDITTCMEACQELRSTAKESGLLSVLSTFHTSYCRWLLLLFSMSHVMIMSETGNSFNTSYVSLFRALDCIRQDLLHPVGRILSRLEGLPRQWVDHGRLCSPRLLFLFEIETDNPAKAHNISTVASCPIKERKEMLQNEIYQIFRKCRIITNISANSLFAIPASDDFVFIFDKSAQNTFSTHQSLSYTYLDMIAASAKKANSKQTSSTTASRTSSSTSLPIKMAFRAHQDTLTYNDSVHSFRNFLQEHITLAHDRGFDDDYRRVSGTKHFFVRPTLGQWETAFAKLHLKLILEPVSERIAEAYFQMEKLINVDSEYLEIQCAELFPKVYATYQRGLPEFYTAQQHQAKLAYAVNLFLNISRGSGVLPWLKKLAEKCEKYWKNGRQQCETLSLLGHVCANPAHKVKRLDHLEIIPLPEMREELPEMQHSSTSRIISYCNCGRRQGTREEPYTIREANYDYYKKLAKDCCDKLESYGFIVFSPTEDNNSELSLQEMLAILQKKSASLSTGNNLQERLDSDNQNQDSLGTPDLPEVFESELRQEDGLEEDESESDDEESDEDKEVLDESAADRLSSEQGNYEHQTLDSNGKGKREAPLALPVRSLYKRASSTVEYLPGMYHSKSPTGLLTLFPSWSLVCLGASSIYSHSHGVSQPGFISGANALLPWDVKVKAEEGVTFAPPLRVFRGRRHRTKPIIQHSSLPTNEFSVKVFFGYEYECRKGHRFFCDSSSSALYSLNYSIATQKTIAGKVIASDMPLYAYCPCKEGRDVKQIAQLVRIHVVTPKAPVFVTLNPKVQPGPMGTCPIFLTGEDHIKLSPSTYWILRFPFSYVGDVVYVPPTDVTRYNGKVLKGTFGVISMSPAETDEWERQNQARS